MIWEMVQYILKKVFRRPSMFAENHPWKHLKALQQVHEYSLHVSQAGDDFQESSCSLPWTPWQCFFCWASFAEHHSWGPTSAEERHLGVVADICVLDANPKSGWFNFKVETSQKMLKPKLPCFEGHCYIVHHCPLFCGDGMVSFMLSWIQEALHRWQLSTFNQHP